MQFKQLGVMKLTIISMVMPYPPTDGGRIDVWRRIKALSKLGVSIQLICWTNDQPEQATRAAISEYVQEFHPILYQRTPAALVQRAFDLLSYPLEVTSRILRGKQRESVLEAVRHFEPDVILGDQIHTGLVASQISQTLNIPLAIRSHDVEYLHYQYYLKCAKGLSKVKRLFSLNHLEQYEKSILKQSKAFFDISKDDLQFWEDQGISNGHFLPPLIEFPESNGSVLAASSSELPYDVVFLGNLHTDNNVAGVTWFLREVVPLLRKGKPDIKVLIAGSNPTSAVKQACQTDNITLAINPASAADTYKSGRVLVDPVSMGSGVSIKSIDMLAMERPIVTTPKGVHGLPEEVKCYFKVANDAQSFASEIIQLLSAQNFDLPDKDVLNAALGYGCVQDFILCLQEISKSR